MAKLKSLEWLRTAKIRCFYYYGVQFDAHVLRFREYSVTGKEM